MRKRISGFLLVFLLCLTFFATYAKADFGDFGGDSDYDYGGYDYDYDDYDYDYDDYDYNYNDYDYSYDNDWSYNDYDYSTGGYSSWGSSSYSTSSGGEDTGSAVFGAIILIIIVLLIWRVLHKGRNTPRGSSKPVTVIPGSAARYQGKAELAAGLKALHEADPLFDEKDFLEDAANLYVRLQNAWTAKDLEPVRPALSDNFFSQMNRQLQTQYVAKGHTNVVEKIAVLGTDLIGCERDGSNDILTVWLNARIVDYEINDETGTLVRGSRTAEKFMTYQWTFTRPIGQKTAAEGAGVDSKHCPNCGAPIDMNQSAVCEYCGATLKAASHDWILTSIKGIRQMTSGR